MKDAPIFVLNEATGVLDSVTETQIRESLEIYGRLKLGLLPDTVEEQ